MKSDDAGPTAVLFPVSFDQCVHWAQRSNELISVPFDQFAYCVYRSNALVSVSFDRCTHFAYPSNALPLGEPPQPKLTSKNSKTGLKSIELQFDWININF